jgi:hypothetical protein
MPIQDGKAMSTLEIISVIAVVAGSAVVLFNGWEDDRFISQYEIAWITVLMFVAGVAIWRSP